MADLTLYLPSTGTAPHDCAFSAFWGGTDFATRYPAATSKGSSSITTHGSYRPNGQTYGLGMQWVSPALAARSWTTSDTFDIAMIVRDSNYPTTTCRLALSVRVFNAAGDTVVGTLYEGVVNAVDMVASWVNRHADGVAIQNNVDCPENGHIVVEVGFASSFAGTIGADFIIGEGSSTALPLNDTETNTDLYPFIAFTYGAAGPSPVNPSSIDSGYASGTAMMKGTIQSEAVAAPTFFGYGRTPTTDAGTNSADPTAVTPPESMAAGDLVLLYAYSQAPGLTQAISEAGGQTWNSGIQCSYTGLSARLFWCRFNGTWTANPSFSAGSVVNNTAVMLVFRPSSGANLWEVDAAEVETDFSAPANPYTVTISGLTLSAPGVVAVARWATYNNNTWGSLSGTGWSKSGLPDQVINLAGVDDSSMSFAYFISTGAGPTGNVSQNQLTLGGTAGNKSIIAFRQV